MRESDIERYLVFKVKTQGGEVRKVSWPGRRGAPDRLVMLPSGGRGWALDALDRICVRADRPQPRTIWVELKATGKKAEPHQLREHDRMRRMGQVVFVVDSLEGVDEVLA